MAQKVTITFSAAGVDPPVYVVTSLSSPAWTILEMHPVGTTESGENVFWRTFENVPAGSYQYKVRIGEGHWVVDEGQEITTDESGNQNNLIHITEEAGDPEPNKDDEDNASDTVVNDSDDAASEVNDNDPTDEKKPTAADEVADQPQRDRAGDAEPEVEASAPASPHPTSTAPSPIIPDIVVEKVDEKPAHVEPGSPEEQAAPLFPHEQDPQEAPPRTPVRRTSTEPLDAIEEESSPQGSSADSNHQSDGADDDEEADDELEQGPRLDHELYTSGFTSNISGSQFGSQNGTIEDDLEDDVEDGTYELQNAPTFGYERMGADESSLAPRFSYERTSGASSVHSSGSPVGQDAPALPHENLNGGDDSRAPLLPHEYSGGIPTPESSDGYSFNGGSLNEDGHGSFGYGVDFGTPAYPERRSSLLLRATTNSSLPHALPRSDDEDPNLNDPSLQQFPTDRQSILERVGTIKTDLPQDETIESPVNSPFVPSQACSSVDLPSAELGPVRSQISLNAVMEEDDDLGDLPSPPQESPITEDEHALQMRKYGGCPGPVDHRGKPITRKSTLSQQLFDANADPSIQKNDGAQDGPRAWSDLYESVATPTKLLASFMPPDSPEKAWLTGIPSDAGSAREPPTDDSNRSRPELPSSSDIQNPSGSMAILPSQPINERMGYKAFDINRDYPYMGNQPYAGRPRTVMQKAMDSVVASFDWFCGCCGLGGPQARTVQGIMAFVVVGAAYYAYGFLHR